MFFGELAVAPLPVTLPVFVLRVPSGVPGVFVWHGHISGTCGVGAVRLVRTCAVAVAVARGAAFWMDGLRKGRHDRLCGNRWNHRGVSVVARGSWVSFRSTACHDGVERAEEHTSYRNTV